ncbi:hypothetical protein DIZ81_06070 [Legionella taurinensis]|uniref:Uncharacterized protein n=1 Tax=Legionella taurinensis TaxID=70611 RepID=A0A3A5L8Z5_9GAMM|nr:hypothetical protein [Legionella taurinensis]MDX1837483.1 hypothetical protein [Legionella taurinensis]PUT40825.1 hypothetical protein DB744_06070 [Legionella taurinensis]PUT44246.1 hypothetical protein DB746_04470 [Legionella taurinensis]PUT47548.1 hypothetical protein DB743_02640 [Legionella taurinensis]PUT48687.1 hypothetical protein DB745_04470 [Legionella taurinensis]
MTALPHFVCTHPYLSMLVFACIGFLLRGMVRVNLQAVRFAIDDLEMALQDNDLEQAKHCVDRLKAGFGWR